MPCLERQLQRWAEPTVSNSLSEPRNSLNESLGRRRYLIPGLAKTPRLVHLPRPLMRFLLETTRLWQPARNMPIPCSL